jgi:hypothetical protein
MVPDWEKGTPGIMYQKVLLQKVVVDGVTNFEAVMEKSKGNLGLEGKRFVVATVREGFIEWYGLKELYKTLGLMKNGK